MSILGGCFCLKFAGRTVEQNAFPTGHYSALSVQIEYDNLVDNYNSCVENLWVIGIGICNKKTVTRYLSFDIGNTYRQRFNLLAYIMLEYWDEYWDIF